MNTTNLFQFFPKDIARTAVAIYEACPQSDAVIAEVCRLHAEGDDWGPRVRISGRVGANCG